MSCRLKYSRLSVLDRPSLASIYYLGVRQKRLRASRAATSSDRKMQILYPKSFNCYEDQQQVELSSTEKAPRRFKARRLSALRVAVCTLDLYLPPIGLGTIVSVLLRKGFEIRIFNIHDAQTALEEAIRFQPDLVMASLFTGSHQRYIEFINTLKKSSPCLSIVGGPHCTFFPEVIEQHDCLDVLCRGEGEHSLETFFDTFQPGGELPTQIPNLYIRSRGVIIKNSFEPLEENLDALPFAERRLFYNTYPHMKQFPVEMFITSRGCPFHCTYCFNNKMVLYFGSHWKKVRCRSPENVVREIEEVMSYKKLEFIEFHDDIFGLKKGWLEEFTKLYKKRINLPFRCNLIPNFITEENAKLLAEANLRGGSIGMQTSNERIRADILKRPGSNEQIEKAIRTLKKYGINVITDTMLGLPESTIKDDWESLRFNHALGVDYAWASIFVPYPGTELAEYAERKGLWDGKIDELPSTFYLKSVLRFSNKHRKMIFILQAFYSLTVNFYFLRYFVKFLFLFPAMGIYKFVPAITQATLLNFKVYRTKYMSKNILRIIPAFFRRTINRMRNVN